MATKELGRDLPYKSSIIFWCLELVQELLCSSLYFWYWSKAPYYFRSLSNSTHCSAFHHCHSSLCCPTDCVAGALIGMKNFIWIFCMRSVFTSLWLTLKIKTNTVWFTGNTRCRREEEIKIFRTSISHSDIKW